MYVYVFKEQNIISNSPRYTCDVLLDFVFDLILKYKLYANGSQEAETYL